MGIRIQSLWLARGSWYSLILILATISWGRAAPQNHQDLDSLISQAEKHIYKDPILSKTLAIAVLNHARELANEQYEARALKIIGGAYFVQGDYDLALEKFLDAYKRYENLSDTTMMSQLLSNVGLVYKNIEDYENSLAYYRRALELVPPQDTLTRSRMINNLGVVFQRLQLFDTAQYFLEESFQLKSLMGDKKGMANTLTNLGIIAFEKNDLRQAINYHRRSLQLETELDNDEGIAKCMNNIGSTFIQLKRYDSAAYYAKLALEIGQRLGTKEQLKQSYETLSLCAENNGDFKNAFVYQSYLMQTKDGLMNEDVSRRLGQLESRLELAAKESEIDRLSYENEIASIQAEEIRNQLIIAIVAAGLIILLLSAVYYQREKKSRAEKLAQESQYDALQKRFIEILNGPQTFELKEDLEALNAKLVNPLTEREYDALKLSLQGLTNKEMGDKLFVSDSTVKFHLRNIYNKLGVSNRKEALEYVVKTS